MADQTFSVDFDNVAPYERIWILGCSRGTTSFRTQRLWTDNRRIEMTLPELDGSEDRTIHHLVAFTRGRQPIWWPIDLKKPVTKLTFNDERTLDVGIWILTGDIERQTIRALNSVLIANAILFEENTGLRLKVSDIIDAVEAARGSVLLRDRDWTSPDDIAARVKEIGTLLPDKKELQSHHINIFLTQSFGNDRTINGTSRFGGGTYTSYIVLTEDALDDLLVHELGHSLAVGHTNGTQPNNIYISGSESPWNVMQAQALLRRYFTEGQVAGMHLCGDSALFTVYGLPFIPETSDWYARNAGDFLPASRMLAEDRNNDAYPLPPQTDASFDARTRPAGVILTASSSKPTTDYQSMIVSAARERYRRRTRQLLREIERRNDPDNVLASHFLRLSQMTVEEYVASDIIRLTMCFNGL